jgi:phosphoglucosamine mutase
MTLGDLHEEVPLWHERMGKVRAVQGKKLLQTDMSQRLIEQARDELGENGRLIVRASGTEPVVRVWAEGVDPASVDSVVQRLSLQLNDQEHN